MTYTPTRESLGSYGGYPLQSPKQELENCAENELDSSPFLDKANTFSFTLGEEPGRGYLLMLASDVANLTSQDPYELVMGIEDRIDNDDAKTARYVTLPSIIFVRAINIYPGIEDDDNALMIVEVADKRHWLQFSVIDRQYNVPAIPLQTSDGAKYIPSTILKIDSTHYRPWTTQEMLADIWQHMPSAIAGFSPPVPDNVYSLSPSFVSERHQYNCVSALEAYCDVLTRLGCSLAYDPIDDEFYIVQSSVSTNTSYGSSTHGFDQDANAFTTFKSVWLNSEQNIDNDYSGFIPEKVVVCFNANYPHTSGDAFHTKPYYKVEYTWSTWAAANPTPATDHNAKTGTVSIIWGDLDARWDSLSESTIPDSSIQTYNRSDFTNATSPNVETAITSPTNLSDLTTRAAELGSLFYFLRAKTGGAFTQDTYEGCCPFRLTGQVPVHRITWYDTGDGWMTDVDFMRDMPEFFLKPRDIRVRDVEFDGGGFPLIRFEIITPDCDSGTATATVTAVSCNAESPQVGDTITLLDEDGWFSGDTNSVLTGRTGTAHKFNIPYIYDDCSYVIVSLSPAPYKC